MYSMNAVRCRCTVPRVVENRGTPRLFPFSFDNAVYSDEAIYYEQKQGCRYDCAESAALVLERPPCRDCLLLCGQNGARFVEQWCRIVFGNCSNVMVMQSLLHY